MSDDTVEPQIQQLRSAHSVAADFIGKDWLESQVDEYFDRSPEENIDFRTEGDVPTALMHYYQSSMDLGIREENFPEIIPESRPTDHTLHFTNLGRFIQNVESAELVSPAGNTKNQPLSEYFAPRLRNSDEFEEAMFEIELASFYAEEGHQVNFISEGQQSAPDILLDFEAQDIFLECKRCNTPGDLKERSGRYESLLNKLTSAIHAPVIIVFEIDRTPTLDETQKVDEVIPQELEAKNHQIKTSYGMVHILNYGSESDVISVQSGDMDMAEVIRSFYNKYVKPVIKSEIGRKFELMKDFEKATLQTKDDKIAASKVEVDFFEPMFVGIWKESEDDFVTPVIRQFDAARGKFDKNESNVLHINVPYLQRLSRDEYNELHQRIRGKLNINRRISAISLSVDIIERDENNNPVFTVLMGSEVNLDPYIPLPEGFEVLGMTLDELGEHQIFE